MVELTYYTSFVNIDFIYRLWFTVNNRSISFIVLEQKCGMYNLIPLAKQIGIPYVLRYDNEDTLFFTSSGTV